MERSLGLVRGLRLFVSVVALLAPASAQAIPGEAQIRGHLGGLRVPFIANQGQVDATVAYYAPTFAGTLFVTQQGQLVYSLPGRGAEAPDGARSPRRAAAGPGWSLTETFRGGTVRPVGHERGVTGVSTFIGTDPARWRRDLPTYGEVGLGEVWPGIDVTLRARGRSVEKIFTVQPGARVERIRVRVGGARALTVDAEGALQARTGLGAVTFTAPIAYQERDGGRRAVAVAYRRHGQAYGFTVGAYDPSLPLVIDPLLQSTYLGGSGPDEARALALHPTTGDVYVAGQTSSLDFPGTTGGAQPASSGEGDAFVARLNGALTALTQATYLGGSGSDVVNALAIHPTTGDVYVAGFTDSSDFPGIGGAQPASGGGGDAFVARLNGALTALTQATYLGGSDGDEAVALALHPTTGDVYVAGQTGSTDFPGTPGGAQPASGGNSDAFVARLNGALTVLTQATYLGGSSIDTGGALALHPTTGDVYVAGFTDSTDFPGTTGGAQPASGGGDSDGFVARLNGALTALTQATYLGGSRADSASALALHLATGDVYVAGSTDSTDFPGTTGGAQPARGGRGGRQDAFVARLNGDLTELTQATYLGGSGNDTGGALALHPTTGDVYVAGFTDSTDFPGTPGGVQPASGGGGDAFVARLNGALTVLTQATYLGGSGNDEPYALALHPTTGDVYVAGFTDSTDFPGTIGGAQPESGGGSLDGFVARLTFDLGVGDLTIAKTHGGDFAQGQVGASYIITVSNVSLSATAGQVTVTDTLPGGLTATALGGPGWSCTLGTLTCTRGDALAGGASYPTITVTVTVAGNAGSPLINTATVSGGGDVSPANNTATDSTTIVAAPDLTIVKTHSGNFARGQVGRTYSLTVSNAGTAATAGQVTVTDTLPGGLTATGLGGTGWGCVLGTMTCTRSDALASGASYAVITVTVNVEVTAPVLVTNTATVSGGGDVNASNNTASDPTTVIAGADLTLAKTHSGNFIQGQAGAIYLVTVSNVGTVATAGQVTVTDTLPGGLTATALGGTGWSCVLGTLTCTRGDALASGASYPAITVTVTVAGNAGSPLINTATVSGGGDVNAGNDTASDPTTVIAGADLTLGKTHSGNFTQGQVGATYAITVSNVGTVATVGPVTVTDTLPGGLTATALGGTGWGCVLGTLTCTRSDALANGASYPAIIVTVTVAGNAGSPLINTATVSGGGDVNPGNNTATDPTTVTAAGADLTLAKAHGGSFIQGQVGAVYLITVSNIGTVATAGQVTVTDTLPGGLTATALSGTGWSCTLGTLTCIRGDALAGGASYPAITVTVTVAGNAGSPLINTATVSGGGDVTAGNNTATDPTVVFKTFVDVPVTDPFFPWIEALAAAGITGGCSVAPPRYCPDAEVTRAEMAVFVLRGLHGAGYDPPPATGTMFTDVPITHPFAKWIEQFAREGITGGCATSPARYCPDAHVTRKETAVFLLRAEHGAGYGPPAASGMFTDVPVAHPLAGWIEQFAREGITGGCGATTFCPDGPTTREQMAVFLVRTFNLPI